MEAVEVVMLDWVDLFDRRRLLGTFRDIPPAKVEENYYAQRDGLDKVA
jgi:putative transposase